MKTRAVDFCHFCNRYVDHSTGDHYQRTCDAIVADFVFGPQYCDKLAVGYWTGSLNERFYYCQEHKP